MQKYLQIFLISFTFFLPLFVYAEEGFLWENPGLDFYTKIDENASSLIEKTVVRRLQETKKFEDFGAGCIGISFLKDVTLDKQILDDMVLWDYGSFSKKISETMKSSGNNRSFSTDTFQALTQCMNGKYQSLYEQSRRENAARLDISYLWLYMDGDKSNSEFDIISDINKINTVIFSQDIIYNGIVNRSKNSLLDFFANKSIAPLFLPDPSLTGVTLSGDDSNGDENGIWWNESGYSESEISDLLSTTCNTDENSPVSIEDIVDVNFSLELQKIRENGISSDEGGFAPVVTLGEARNNEEIDPKIRFTSAGDFFHKMPCEWFFCIDVKMIPGAGFSLGGGKSVSIESILDQRSNHILPISESALSCEFMTNNFASFPKKNLSLASTLAGLRPSVSQKVQLTRRDKKEATPERSAEELKDIMRCAAASVGLDTERARANSIGWAGFVSSRWANTETIDNKALPLGPQESPQIKVYTDCIENYMQSGRKTYYDSFSTDVTEVQAYTDAMLSEITNIVSILDAMNDKPYCSK